VEDREERGFVPADAAVPPDDDRRGAFDVASARTYQVTVSDGILDISIASEELDRPASISALVIRREE
jgi:hypothetical protein